MEPNREIPRDNRVLVEDSTHPEALAALQGERWQQHEMQVTGAGIAQTIRAHYAALGSLYKKDFGSFTFDDIKGEARTRLGMDNLRLPLAMATTSPFGIMLDEMLIPGHLAQFDTATESPEITEQTHHADGIHFRLGSHLFQYTRLGLERIDEPAD
jgi:CRISPR-associated endonuclease/helicase Cas3